MIIQVEHESARWITMILIADGRPMHILFDRELFEMGGDDAARILFTELQVAAKIGRSKKGRAKG